MNRVIALVAGLATLWSVIGAAGLAPLTLKARSAHAEGEPAEAQRAAIAVAEPDVATVFAQWSATTPGCAVGVGRAGRPILEKGFGMADLERQVRNAGDTIFEAGSVSKQFTAAAVLLLAKDGKLSLDEPVRTYIPELPDLGKTVTIRHMLTHTSGLRDWGSVAGLAGWPRTTRVHTHAHVLDILSRQRGLNFDPGTRWSYSNSGYNLAAVLVSRVSGQSFADFTRTRIFEPLGMSNTSWRDDHTRVVPRRAVAYERQADGYHTDMPFENVHGNGGLLTTVADLLTWNENFVAPRVGGAAFVAAQVTPGRFNDGRAHDYGMGVWVGEYRGTREVRHSGSTAGYRAYLTRFPDHHTSVAVLCNAGDADAGALTYKVADVVLGQSLEPRVQTRAGHTLSGTEKDRIAGLYRNLVTGVPTRIVPDGSGVRVERGPALVAESATTLVTDAKQRWVFDGNGGVSVTDRFGSVDRFEKVEAATPESTDLRSFEGTYTSDEAEAVLKVALEGSGLVIRRRPDSVLPLTPLYQDAFSSSMGTIIFRRDGQGRVKTLGVSQDRVWDLRFDRIP